MATKADQFRYQSERTGPKKPKQPPRPPRNFPIDTAAPGVSATDRKALPRKPAKRAGDKAAYALEPSTRRPSRRSTRKAANRQKTDVKMRQLRRLGKTHR